MHSPPLNQTQISKLIWDQAWRCTSSHVGFGSPNPPSRLAAAKPAAYCSALLLPNSPTLTSPSPPPLPPLLLISRASLDLTVAPENLDRLTTRRKQLRWSSWIMFANMYCHVQSCLAAVWHMCLSFFSLILTDNELDESKDGLFNL